MRKQKKKRQKKQKGANIGRDLNAVGAGAGAVVGGNSYGDAGLASNRVSEEEELVAKANKVIFSAQEMHFMRTVRTDIIKIVFGLVVVGVYLGAVGYYFVSSDFLVKLSALLARISGLSGN